MHKAETIFWGFVLISGVYLAATFTFGPKVNAQASVGAPVAVPPQAAPMKGTGCMANGGGCGCGGMRMKP